MKCVFFNVLYKCCLKHFPFQEELSEMWPKNLCWSSCKVPVMLVSFQRVLKISRQIFEKYSNIKFLENPPLGAE